MTVITRMIPLLVCEDIEAEYQFLVEVFRFTPGFLHRDDAGQVVHGELRAGAVDIWLHRVAPEHNLESMREKSVASTGIVVLVGDVDAHYEHVCARGARVDGPPEDRPYGQRDFGARDIEGHRWWFATPL